MDKIERSERRQHKRISFNKGVEVLELGLFQCLNLSVGGMYLEAMIPYHGRQDALEIQFNVSEARIIKVHGRVIYNYNPRGIGIRFLDLKPEDREKIENIISQTQ